MDTRQSLYPRLAPGAPAAPKALELGTLRSQDLKKPLKPLSLAATFIDAYRERDEKFPDYAWIIKGGSAAAEYVYADPSSETGILAPYRQTDFVAVPDEIFDQYNTTQSYTRMGLLPQIDRAWISVDNRLYFWNYRSGQDYLTFEDLSHTILSVNVVKPRPDTFVDPVSHLLVICTPLDLYLLAVSLSKDKHHMQLYDTGMTTSIKGLDVTTISVSDQTGRIFFSGLSDGPSLWEVVYSNVESWTRGRCTKICHTRSPLLQALVPALPRGVASLPLVGSIISPAQTETLVAIEIDDSRRLLYTLSSTSTIQTFALGAGEQLTLLHTYGLSQIQSHLQMAVSSSSAGQSTAGQSSANVMAGASKIVAIQAVHRYQSDQIYLVAITSQGYRLYIQAARSMMYRPGSSATTGPGDRPSNLQVVQARIPPTAAGSSTKIESLLNNTRPTSAVFDRGHFFCVVAKTVEDPATKKLVETGDSVFVATLDSPRVSLSATPQLIEHCTFLDVQGYVQSIKVLNGTSPAPSSTTTTTTTTTTTIPGFCNESAFQFGDDPAPQVAVLTNTGVYIFTRRLPVRVFADLVAHNANLRSVFDMYGRIESCANALSIAAAAAEQDEQAELAKQMYIEVGGKAHVKVDDENTLTKPSSLFPDRTGSIFPDVKNPPAEDSGEGVVRLSGRFDGLATYLARILRDVWTAKVFVPRTKSDPSASSSASDTSTTSPIPFTINAHRAQLETIQLRLFEIETFLDRNRTLIDGLSAGSGSSLPLGSGNRRDELALQGEHRGMDALVRLIKSTRQGIAFLAVLLDYNGASEAVMAQLAGPVKTKLEAITFKSFFTSPEGTELARELVTSLINHSMEEGGSVDAIARTLQDRCDSYCSSKDVLVYKALEALRKAKLLDQEYSQNRAVQGVPTAGTALSSSSLELKLQYVQESVELFKTAADNMSLDSVAVAVTQLSELRAYPGAIDVCLAVARVCDRGNVALGYLKAGKPANDDRAVQYEMRLKLYELVFKALDEADRWAELGASSSGALPSFPDPTATFVRDESYDLCFKSTDELFHYTLYDWFFDRELQTRLLRVETPFMLPYLETRAKDNLQVSDFVWLYCQTQGDLLAAAQRLFELALSNFELPLAQRLEFLCRARGYCNANEVPAVKARQVTYLTLEIQQYIDMAGIQDDLLARVKQDPRFADEKRQEAVAALDGRIKTASELFNDYADMLGYHDICLAILQATDYRNQDEVVRMWDQLLEDLKEKGGNVAETISDTITRLGHQFGQSELVFPVAHLVSELQTLSLDLAGAARGWVVDTFVNAGISHEVLYLVYRDLFERREHPFSEPPAQRRLAQEIVYLLDRWLTESRGRATVTRADLQRFEGVLGHQELEPVLRKLRSDS